MANFAWAIERVIQGADSRPLERQEDAQRQAAEATAANPLSGGPKQNAPVRYRIATLPPDYWLPLVPYSSRAVAPRSS